MQMHIFWAGFWLLIIGIAVFSILNAIVPSVLSVVFLGQPASAQIAIIVVGIIFLVFGVKGARKGEMM